MNPKMNVKMPDSLAKRIVEFATNEQNIGKYFEKNSIGEGRRYCTLNMFDLDLTRDVKQFAKYAYQQIGVDDFIEEHMFGNFIGVNTHGGNVHQHTDPRHKNGHYHIRLNFLVQKPKVGGNPVIDSIEYQMNEGDSWINYASEWQHASTPVDGDRCRIVLSLGAYIDPKVVQKITDRINSTESTEIDYSRVLRPQEDLYDVRFMLDVKKKAGWKQYEYPPSLLKFDNSICMLPKDNPSEIQNIKNLNFTYLENHWKSSWQLGYNNIISLVDILTPHFSSDDNKNISGHVGNTAKYGYPNTWGIMCTFTSDSSVIFTNIFHELMHWKLLALGFGTGPNQFFPTTKEFILNDESELCWSIVNSYSDTAQAAVGNKATDRPVSASLHAYVSFLGVAYGYVQFLKHDKNDINGIVKTKQWGERFEKSFEELLKVGKFTDKGQQLMKGLALWTADFYKEYSKL